MGRPKHEAGKHQSAFELYYAMGADRSLSAVAHQLGASVQALQGWSAAFGWQRRVAERERFVATRTAQKAIQDEAQSRADALKICRAVQVRFAQALSSGAPVGARDFIEATKLEQLLRGKATDRSELMIGGAAFDKLIDAIAAVIEREVKDQELRGKIAAGISEAASGIGAGIANA
jgi:hypothetical protein